ncbi:MAG: PDZ domain-containing protein [Bacteroidales bacterium]|nr:PDZ domain-containing protein [Bacteroidales bacterium]
MKSYRIILMMVLIAVIAYGCRDPEPDETEILNEWIWDVMNDVYLWSEDIDPSLYPTNETDPEAFFYSILSDNDRFSWIVDDYQALLNSFNNIELSSGISPYFIRAGETDQVVVIVEYVSKGSPAESAGIMRGDIIVEINGTMLTIDNYVDLFYNESLTLEFADFTDSGITANGKSVSITAKVIEQNPVIYSDVIDFHDQKIGYIVYTGFSLGEGNKWQDSLDYIFADFQNSGITDLIMDIRYNPGGRVSVATHIASTISPSDIPGSENVFVNYEWNSAYNEYFLNEEGENSENLVVLFEDDPYINFDLDNIYFLTSPHSASASELIIIGLQPYMNVVQIGEYTYGKCYGSITIPDIEDPPRHNWAMQPIVFKFANADGFTDFNDGLVPSIYIDDNLLIAKQFGDITDPIVARALEEITGVSPVSKKALSRRTSIGYELLPDPVRDMKSSAIK